MGGLKQGLKIMLRILRIIEVKRRLYHSIDKRLKQISKDSYVAVPRA